MPVQEFSRGFGRTTARILTRDGLDLLLDALRARGRRVIGPVVRDGAIVYDDLLVGDELPSGWTDAQDAGTYRLERRADDAVFGYAVGPDSWKRQQLPADARIWRARALDDGTLTDFQTDDAPPEPLALIGVRSCE